MVTPSKLEQVYQDSDSSIQADKLQIECSCLRKN